MTHCRRLLAQQGAFTNRSNCGKLPTSKDYLVATKGLAAEHIDPRCDGRGMNQSEEV